jgi:hypothetical protein
MSGFDFGGQTMSGGAGIPSGAYRAKFTSATFHPKSDGDPMSGKGRREYDGVQFQWEITDGPQKGRQVSRETSTNTGPTAYYPQVVGWLTGTPVAAGDRIPDPNTMAGREYMITVAPKNARWNHVVSAIPLPTA